MRVHPIFSAAAVLLASVAGAQTATVTPKSDSGCVATEGRIECRKISRDGDNFFRIEGRDGRFNIERMRMDSAMMKRAILGIELRPTGTKRDSLGVFVESVIPKGPAENAGIVEGDRIAAINGVDLRTSGADADDPYTNGLAAHRLTREVQKLTPGARVNLRVYSGGRFRDVSVTTGRASDFPHEGGFRIQFGGPGMMEFNGGPGMFRMEGPGPMKIDPEHLRTMIEQHLKTGDGHTVNLRVPMRAGPMRMAPMRMMPPMTPRRLIRV